MRTRWILRWRKSAHWWTADIYCAPFMVFVVVHTLGVRGGVERGPAFFFFRSGLRLFEKFFVHSKHEQQHPQMNVIFNHENWTNVHCLDLVCRTYNPDHKDSQATVEAFNKAKKINLHAHPGCLRRNLRKVFSADLESFQAAKLALEMYRKDWDRISQQWADRVGEVKEIAQETLEVADALEMREDNTTQTTDVTLEYGDEAGDTWRVRLSVFWYKVGKAEVDCIHGCRMAAYVNGKYLGNFDGQYFTSVEQAMEELNAYGRV